jgi:hypothetical protein
MDCNQQRPSQQLHFLSFPLCSLHPPFLAAVLVTNHLVGGSDERRHEKRAAMGESWRNQPHARIQLGRPALGEEGAAPHTATLRASSLLPAGLSVAFHISGAGLESGPPPGPEYGVQPMQP